ncbi:MAG: type II secretion system F family protein [Ruminococcus sp.]|nr:type II secretion system F family protein [Ruminococcus sp.]
MLLPVGGFLLREELKDCCQKKETEFRVQFQESMKLMMSALKVGYSVENAIRSAEGDLEKVYPKNSRICKEFRRMRYELDMNRTAEQVLKAFAERVKQEDVDDFVTVFSAAKRAGGDSIAILKNAVRMIGDKIEVEREIQVMLAAKKLEFQVMCVVPLGLVLYMRMAFPEFFDVLYGNVVGVIVMSVCLGIYGLAWQMGRKITAIIC